MERFAKIINKNLHKTFHLRWDEVLKNGPSKICGRKHSRKQPTLRFALLPYYRQIENLIQQRNSKHSIPEFVIADIKNK